MRSILKSQQGVGVQADSGRNGARLARRATRGIVASQQNFWRSPGVNTTLTGYDGLVRARCQRVQGAAQTTSCGHHDRVAVG